MTLKENDQALLFVVCVKTRLQTFFQNSPSTISVDGNSKYTSWCLEVD
jgi:hypothetical protein